MHSTCAICAASRLPLAERGDEEPFLSPFRRVNSVCRTAEPSLFLSAFVQARRIWGGLWRPRGAPHRRRHPFPFPYAAVQEALDSSFTKRSRLPDMSP